MASRTRIRRARRRSIGKVVAAIIVFLLLCVGTAVGVIWLLPLPFYEDIEAIDPGVAGDAAQIARGKRLVSLACAGCHASAEESRLVGRTMIEVPDLWGTVVAPNLTHSKTSGLGSVTDAQIARALRSGVRHDGMFLLPFMPRYARMADDDLAAIVAFLRSDDPMVSGVTARPGDTVPSLVVKLRAQFTWRPSPPPSEPVVRPDGSDPIALGKYLVDDLLQCNLCHGSNEESVPLADPTTDTYYLGGGMVMKDLNGKAITPRNLTPDQEHGLGKWTYEQFRAALTDGRTIDGRQLRWPMRRYWELEEAEVKAIWGYLQTVDPQTKEADEPAAYRIPGQKLDIGRHVFFKYGCFSCHGEKTPHGILRETAQRFDSDEKLALYIAEPTAGNGLGAMPGFAGRISDEELLALAKYVRGLATATRGR